ncbi:hypothetical protein N0V88_004514 [Collariella sp. IMI 366227]|nr:hypothetical protein N0V88_004514 [Collariella sp. IMI 366227]
MRPQYISALLLNSLVAACPIVNKPTPTATTAAAPAATTTTTPGSNTGGDGGSGPSVTADQILAIMPKSKSCDGAQFPDECRTATAAAPFIQSACAKYSLNTAECAATIALMAVESGELKFKHNVFPGRAGQGTANMMMPNFVTQYATSIFGATDVTGKEPNAVLAMVTNDNHNFASAAWYLVTTCKASEREALQKGDDAGWLEYHNCIGVDGNAPDRMPFWVEAKKAFGL